MSESKKRRSIDDARTERDVAKTAAISAVERALFPVAKAMQRADRNDTIKFTVHGNPIAVQIRRGGVWLMGTADTTPAELSRFAENAIQQAVGAIDALDEQADAKIAELDREAGAYRLIANVNKKEQ